MWLLTLFLSGASAAGLPRSLLRDAAAQPTPPVPGLRSRFWRAGRAGAVHGRYLFAAPDAAKAFVADVSADPAVRVFVEAGLGVVADAVVRIESPPALFDRPVFVLAAPRSGGTLLCDLLSRATGVWTLDGEGHGPVEGVSGLHPGDRGYRSHALSDFDATPDAAAALRAGLYAELRDRDGRALHAAVPADGRMRMIEKTPENLLRVSFLAKAFPDARFVFLHREGRQNVSSLVEGWRHGGFVNLPRLEGWDRGDWCFALIEDWQRLNGASLSEVAACQWATMNRQALDALELLDPARWTALGYEELIDTPRAAMERVCAFAGLEMSAELNTALGRELPLSATTTTAPSPIKWKSNPLFREHDLRLYRPISGRLRELGSRSAPPPPPQKAIRERYACFVETLEPAAAAEWRVAPSLRLQLGPSVPLDLVRRSRFRERFVDDAPVLWIEDARTGALLPYFAHRRQAAALRRLVPGAPAPDLDPALAGRLARAGILVPDRPEGEEAAIHAADTQRANADFAARGWCELPSLLPLPQAQAVAEYLEALVQRGDWQLGDAQVDRRYGWHNEPVVRFFQHQLSHFVAGVVGEAVRPSYCYASLYREGASLRPHLDREQCLYTITLWVTRSGGVEAPRWPLWFRTAEGKACATQSAGDAVLFRGAELPHWREQPPPGGEGTTLLFHYVPLEFRGVLG